MATLKIYSKDQTDALLANKADTSALPTASQLVPSTSGATQGNVLTVGASGPEWASGGSGGGVQAHTYANFGELVTDYLAHQNAICVIKSFGSYVKSVAFSTNRLDFHFYNFSFNQNTNFTFWYQTFDANTSSTATTLNGSSFRGQVYPTSLSYNTYSGTLNIEDITLYY